MNGLKFKASELAYHLERLSQSQEVRETIESKDLHAFRQICKNLKVPQIHIYHIQKIIFSVTPNQAWPWA